MLFNPINVGRTYSDKGSDISIDSSITEILFDDLEIVQYLIF